MTLSAGYTDKLAGGQKQLSLYCKWVIESFTQLFFFTLTIQDGNLITVCCSIVYSALTLFLNCLSKNKELANIVSKIATIWPYKACPCPICNTTLMLQICSFLDSYIFEQVEIQCLFKSVMLHFYSKNKKQNCHHPLKINLETVFPSNAWGVLGLNLKEPLN